MSTSSSAIFTGSSQFASDLQSALQRSIQFASLPLQQLQTDATVLQAQQSEFSTLNTDFGSVMSAIQSITSAVGQNSFAATLSDSSIASVTLGATPQPGTYTLNVINPGVYASSMASDGLPTVADPTTENVSDATGYALTIGSDTYNIQPTGTSLSALAAAINQDGHAAATIVNIGSSSAPDYRLFVQGTQLGDHPIQLTANNGSNPGQTLLTTQTTGESATYQVNGLPSTLISTDSSTVTIAPGVTVALQAAGSTSITVGRSISALSSALSNFATVYNTASAELAKNHGSNGGALVGNSMITTLSQALSQVSGYTSGSGGYASLSDLGFSFDSSGQLSFDPTVLSGASDAQFSQIASFLGSSTSGFLGAATSEMTSITDPTTGILPGAVQSAGNQVTNINNRITDEQDRVNNLQVTLTSQMNAADAAIAGMEQQLTYFQNLFYQMQVTSQLSK